MFCSVRQLLLGAGLLLPAFAAPAQPSSPPIVLPRGEAQVEWIKIPRPPLPQEAGRAAMSKPKPMKDEPAEPWTILMEDRTFYQTLQRWSRQAGWQLVWEAERDFAIDAQITLQGNFLQVLDQCMRALRETDHPLRAVVNADTRVLRITRHLLDGERQ